MTGPNKDGLCRVLIIGVGSIGERHTRCFLKTGRAAVSICEVNAQLREEVARRYDIERMYADVESALVEPHDAVVVAVPANLHIAIARQTIQAGLHLLIEKPLSVSMDGVEELLQAVSEKGRVAAVAYVWRAHPSLSAMRDFIVAGEFGKPLQLVAVAGQHFPTYRPAYRSTYFANRATGGGTIQDALTHVLNAGEWLVGPVDRLVADADHKSLDGVSVEDVVHLIARHGSVLASYSMNQFQAPNELTITVVCEHGTVRFESHQQRWRRMLQPDENWQDELLEPFDRDFLFVKQANSFLDAIQRDSKLLCSLADGVQSQRVNCAAIKSAESGAWQMIERGQQVCQT
jgi:predicted dehydrogenase